jgi:hypothetical protein
MISLLLTLTEVFVKHSKIVVHTHELGVTAIWVNGVVFSLYVHLQVLFFF